MGHRILFMEDRDPTRTAAAREALPGDLDAGFASPSASRDELAAAFADCEVLINPGAALVTEHLEMLPKLRLLQLLSAGFDNFDIPTIFEHGVRVANNSGAIANSVAEHAVLLMMAVYRRLSQAIDGPRESVWSQKAKTGPHGRLYELTGRTVGIVGLGHIGSHVAARLRGFDTTTLYHDIREFPPERERELAVQRVSFEELLERSHVVTAHVPLTSQTRGMFGVDEFSAMRDEAIFINTCRGPVHDEAALIRALDGGEIWAAGLDVTEVEPTPADNRLLRMDNAVVTPHSAGSSQERVNRAMVFSWENARRVLAGEEPESLIELWD